MNERGQNRPENIVPFAPASRDPDQNAVDALDDAGRTVMGLLQQAANTAKENCGRALSVAHGLSLQLRASEDRIKELENALQHFQDRALRAENWLQRISREIENRFLEPREASHSPPDTRQPYSVASRRP
jgi:site-specific recombinase